MIKRTFEILPGFTFSSTSISNQLFLTISITEKVNDIENLIERIYTRISRLLSDTSSYIVLERVFGDIGIYNHFVELRQYTFQNNNIDSSNPFTYIEGKSCTGSKIGGIQIWAVNEADSMKIHKIIEKGRCKGFSWKADDSLFFVLSNIGNLEYSTDNKNSQSYDCKDMFYRANHLLEQNGTTYKSVVRTWIYLSNILKWYDKFNEVRNSCYSDFGLLSNVKLGEMDKVFLPASTGIEGKNPSNLPSVMDLFAIHRLPNSGTSIKSFSGVKQSYPYFYGSAFSRAVVIDRPNSKLILVSGTASIDKNGKSIFIDDPEGQIRYAFEVISKLIEPEGATLQDISEATAFFKRGEYYKIFQKVIDELEIPRIPTVNLIADICRDELLFEIDALVLLEK